MASAARRPQCESRIRLAIFQPSASFGGSAGLRVDEAATVFADPDALDGPDLDHSEHEARSLRMGKSLASDPETIRIISAGRASRNEREAYRPIKAD